MTLEELTERIGNLREEALLPELTGGLEQPVSLHARMACLEALAFLGLAHNSAFRACYLEKKAAARKKKRGS